MIQKCQRTYDIYQLMVMPGYPNANFANEREWTQIHINERKVKSEK